MTAADPMNAYYSTVDLTAGQFEHEAWSSAEPVAISRYWSGETAPPGRQALAKIVWTEHALCVRFDCQQTEPLVVSVFPRTNEKTLGLWEWDVCELFAAPDPSQPHHYFEFEAAPTGEWIDLALLWTAEKRETEWNFQSGMSAAARIAPNQIQIGMRIPWSERLPQPELGDEWRINLCRCVGSGDDRGYLCWQPTHTEVASFHLPEAFGRLRFS
jgi:hypothetical protein